MDNGGELVQGVFSNDLGLRRLQKGSLDLSHLK